MAPRRSSTVIFEHTSIQKGPPYSSSLCCAAQRAEKDAPKVAVTFAACTSVWHFRNRQVVPAHWSPEDELLAAPRTCSRRAHSLQAFPLLSQPHELRSVCRRAIRTVRSIRVVRLLPVNLGLLGRGVVHRLPSCAMYARSHECRLKTCSQSCQRVARATRRRSVSVCKEKEK